jgi:hypothetical protein
MHNYTLTSGKMMGKKSLASPCTNQCHELQYYKEGRGYLA